MVRAVGLQDNNCKPYYTLFNFNQRIIQYFSTNLHSKQFFLFAVYSACIRHFFQIAWCLYVLKEAPSPHHHVLCLSSGGGTGLTSGANHQRTQSLPVATPYGAAAPPVAISTTDNTPTSITLINHPASIKKLQGAVGGGKCSMYNFFFVSGVCVGGIYWLLNVTWGAFSVRTFINHDDN